MKILSIETSCDETAVSIVEAMGEVGSPVFTVLSNLVLSQIKLHEKYGGVFPNLAKREHAKNLVPLVRAGLEEAKLFVPHSGSKTDVLNSDKKEKIKADLIKESELVGSLFDLLESCERPDIDLIAVTFGPGLEPALWVGINVAKVLGEIWNIPVMPVNHMEGHISSVLLNASRPVRFPALALLISGGHTELVKISDWLTYEVIGQTRDDAVGEAYDKVARMMGLPYPGGPQIAALAEQARAERDNDETTPAEPRFVFPRPMIKSPDYDFSFSGLKTSVLYTIRDISKKAAAAGDSNSSPELDLETKKAIAMAFEDAVVETLVAKTKKAIEDIGPQSLIIAGGVVANKTIRTSFEALVAQFSETELLVPTQGLSTDNALMIALAAFVRNSIHPMTEYSEVDTQKIKAEGNVQL